MNATMIACVDFDGTIVPWGPLMDPHKRPIDGIPEAMQKLKDAGYQIVIHTSRLSWSWLTDSGNTEHEQRLYIEKILNDNGIEYDEITAEKIKADVYFDDLAIRVAPHFPLNHAIEAFLLGHT